MSSAAICEAVVSVPASRWRVVWRCCDCVARLALTRSYRWGAIAQGGLLELCVAVAEDVETIEKSSPICTREREVEGMR